MKVQLGSSSFSPRVSRLMVILYAIDSCEILTKMSNLIVILPLVMHSRDFDNDSPGICLRIFVHLYFHDLDVADSEFRQEK